MPVIVNLHQVVHFVAVTRAAAGETEEMMRAVPVPPGNLVTVEMIRVIQEEVAPTMELGIPVATEMVMTEAETETT